MATILCGECGNCTSAQAETCPDCGYPLAALIGHAPVDGSHVLPTSSREYQLMLALGIGVAAVGVLALLAHSLLAAVLAIASGLGTGLSALLGLWHNTRVR